MLGYVPAELVGRSVDQFADPDRPGGAEAASGALETRTRSYETTANCRHRSGRTVSMRCTVSYLAATPDFSASYAALLLDLTQTADASGDVASPSEVGDKAAARRDVAGAVRDQAGDKRDDASDQRDLLGNRRDLLAGRRDRAADQRDRAADQRDHSANNRDREGTRRDKAAADRDDRSMQLMAGEVPGLPTVSARITAARHEAESDRVFGLLDREAGADERAHARSDRLTSMADRASAGSERAQSEKDRTVALSNRESGAGERARAEDDRSASRADRGASARERDHYSFDTLTGAHVRAAGVVELGREISRAARTGQSLIVAYIDVDNLKSVNDSAGHGAGDDLLRATAEAIRAGLRSYDLIVRYGGDEFVCAIPGLNMRDAAARLSKANLTLATLPAPASFTRVSRRWKTATRRKISSGARTRRCTSTAANVHPLGGEAGVGGHPARTPSPRPPTVGSAHRS